MHVHQGQKSGKIQIVHTSVEHAPMEELLCQWKSIFEPGPLSPKQMEANGIRGEFLCLRLHYPKKKKSCNEAICNFTHMFLLPLDLVELLWWWWTLYWTSSSHNCYLQSRMQVKLAESSFPDLDQHSVPVLTHWVASEWLIKNIKRVDTLSYFVGTGILFTLFHDGCILLPS